MRHASLPANLNLHLLAVSSLSLFSVSSLLSASSPQALPVAARPPTSTMPSHASSHPSPAPLSNPLKILMLHGYTQSGALFHAKTRALEKHLQKALSPSLASSIHLTYATGPLPLHPSDIPGFSASIPSSSPPESELFAWWRRSNTADPPEYIDLEEGLAAVAHTLAERGPFDGVIGFSQGAALAAMVASLLERPAREAAFAHFAAASPLGIPYPASFAALAHPPLRFAICYSGFRAPGPRYRGFYEGPGICTPALHFLGSVDTVVEEARSMALVETWETGREEMVVWHPGGHFLPSQKVYLDRVALFIRECVEGAGQEEGKGTQEEEESVEDMEVPF